MSLKVSSKSNPNSVAGAIAGNIKNEEEIEIKVIGAGALNQAIKAVAIARGFVVPTGIDLCIYPSYTEISDLQTTGILLRIRREEK